MLHLVTVDCALPTTLFSRWRWQVFVTEKPMPFMHVQQGAFSMSSGYPHGNLEMGIEFTLFWHGWHLCQGWFFFSRRLNKLPNGHCATWTPLQGCLDFSFLWSFVIFKLFSYKLRSHDHQDRACETSQVELFGRNCQQSWCHNKRGKHASNNEQSSSTGFFLTLLEAWDIQAAKMWRLGLHIGNCQWASIEIWTPSPLAPGTRPSF